MVAPGWLRVRGSWRWSLVTCRESVAVGGVDLLDAAAAFAAAAAAAAAD